MKIEVLTTLKGNIGEMFYKGDVFVSPNIPNTLMMELSSNRGNVRVIPEAEAPIETIPEPEPEEIVEELVEEVVEEVPLEKLIVEPKKIVKLDPPHDYWKKEDTKSVKAKKKSSRIPR